MSIRLLDQGKKQDEVANLISVTRKTISVWVNKRKRGDRRGQYPEDEEAGRMEIKED